MHFSLKLLPRGARPIQPTQLSQNLKPNIMACSRVFTARVAKSNNKLHAFHLMRRQPIIRLSNNTAANQTRRISPLPPMAPFLQLFRRLVFVTRFSTNHFWFRAAGNRCDIFFIGVFHRLHALHDNRVRASH